MEKNKVVFFLFLFFYVASESQISTKFWVEFKDKNNTPYSLSNPTVFLTPASVQRRQMYSIPLDSTDLPVNPSYIQAVKNVSGVTVLYASKWLNAVAIAVTNTSALSTIQTFSFVKNQYPVNLFKIQKEKDYFFEPHTECQRNTNYLNYYGNAWWQTKMLNADCLHSAGYRGQGIKIAILDAGFYNANVRKVFDSLYARGGVLGTRDFVSGGTSVYEDDSHGTSVLSCMAALWPNVMVGTAPRADYWLLRTEDVSSETPSEEYNWIRGIEFSDSVGCDVANTSLGYNLFDNPSQNHTYAMLNGKTIPMSRAATMACRKGMLLFHSAGNEGGSSWQYITVPADADSIVTVGSVDSLGNPSFFSSKGPTADGRIKPDFVARGSSAAVASAWSDNILYSNGTSFSSPVLAGAVACFWQKNKTLHPAKIIDSLKKTSSLSASPNNTLGWGIPNMCSPASASEFTLPHTEFLEIYPNPASDNLTLVCHHKVNIVLYDITSKKILQKEILSSGEHLLNLSGIPAGVYYIHAASDGRRQVFKLLKE